LKTSKYKKWLEEWRTAHSFSPLSQLPLRKLFAPPGVQRW